MVCLNREGGDMVHYKFQKSYKNWFAGNVLNHQYKYIYDIQ